jgi:HK97 family phage major capsid protein
MKALKMLEAYQGRPQGADTPELAQKAKDAAWFTKARRSLRGDLGKTDTDVTVDQMDAYTKAWVRMARVGEKMLTVEEMKDMSVGSDPDGGYWITPPTISNEVIRRIFETSPMREISSVQVIGTRDYILPEDPNDVGAGWVAETATRSNSTTFNPQRRVITANEEYAQPAVTQQMLEDSMIDIEAYLAMRLADKFERLENTAFVNGTGVGQPRGFLTYPSGTTWGTQLEQIGSGTSGVFTYTGLVKLITAIKDKYQKNANFLIQRQQVYNIMTLVDGNGRLIFQPIVNGSFNNTPLLGYPLRYATDMPAVGAGALSLAFGDFKAGYQIVDRVGLSTIRDNLTSKPNILFYTRKRVGGDVIDFDAIKIQVLT